MTKAAPSHKKNPWGLSRPLTAAPSASPLSAEDKQQIAQTRNYQKQQLLSQLHQARLNYYGLDRQRNQALHSLNRLQRQFDELSQAEADDYYTI